MSAPHWQCLRCAGEIPSRGCLDLSGRGTEFGRVGDEGTKATFTFCPTCGATVFYVLEHCNDAIAIPVGAFAAPSFPAPSFSEYEDRMQRWAAMPKDMEHLA